MTLSQRHVQVDFILTSMQVNVKHVQLELFMINLFCNAVLYVSLIKYLTMVQKNVFWFLLLAVAINTMTLQVKLVRYDEATRKCISISYITSKSAKNLIHDNFTQWSLDYDKKKSLDKNLQDCPLGS